MQTFTPTPAYRRAEKRYTAAYNLATRTERILNHPLFMCSLVATGLLFVGAYIVPISDRVATLVVNASLTVMLAQIGLHMIYLAANGRIRTRSLAMMRERRRCR